MHFSAENLELRKKFLTPELSQKLASSPEGSDPFTIGTGELPRAFRVGECTVVSPTETEFQVLLFWRDETRTEQREITVGAAKQNDKWLIEKVPGTK